jgi:hypothetical protein
MKEDNDLTMLAIELRVVKVAPPPDVRIRLRVRGRVDDWYTVQRWDVPPTGLTAALFDEIWEAVNETGKANVVQLLGIQAALGM